MPDEICCSDDCCSDDCCNCGGCAWPNGEHQWASNPISYFIIGVLTYSAFLPLRTVFPNITKYPGFEYDPNKTKEKSRGDQGNEVSFIMQEVEALWITFFETDKGFMTRLLYDVAFSLLNAAVTFFRYVGIAIQTMVTLAVLPFYCLALCLCGEKGAQKLFDAVYKQGWTINSALRLKPFTLQEPVGERLSKAVRSCGLFSSTQATQATQATQPQASHVTPHDDVESPPPNPNTPTV